MESWAHVYPEEKGGVKTWEEGGYWGSQVFGAQIVKWDLERGSNFSSGIERKKERISVSLEKSEDGEEDKLSEFLPGDVFFLEEAAG